MNNYLRYSRCFLMVLSVSTYLVIVSHADDYSPLSDDPILHPNHEAFLRHVGDYSRKLSNIAKGKTKEEKCTGLSLELRSLEDPETNMISGQPAATMGTGIYREARIRMIEEALKENRCN